MEITVNFLGDFDEKKNKFIWISYLKTFVLGNEQRT